MFKPGISEASIFYNDFMKSYYVLYCNNYFGDNNIYIHTSKSIEGPWKTDVFFVLPSPYSNTKGVFCYAIKSHPQFAGKNEIVFSIVCNSNDLSILANNLWVYTPIFFRATYRKKTYKD